MTANELRKFLEQCQNSVLPIVYNDGLKQRQVALARVTERSYKDSAGKDETVAALTLVEAQPESLEGGASGARAQEIHLLNCLNSLAPSVYHSTRWGKLRVFLTQMRKIAHAFKKGSDERAYALTLVEAWGGIWLYDEVPLKLTITATATLRTHTTTGYGYGCYGFGQYEAV